MTWRLEGEAEAVDFHSAVQGFTQCASIPTSNFCSLFCSQVKRPLTSLGVRTEVRVGPGLLRATGRTKEPHVVSSKPVVTITSRQGRGDIKAPAAVPLVTTGRGQC